MHFIQLIQELIFLHGHNGEAEIIMLDFSFLLLDFGAGPPGMPRSEVAFLG